MRMIRVTGSPSRGTNTNTRWIMQTADKEIPSQYPPQNKMHSKTNTKYCFENDKHMICPHHITSHHITSVNHLTHCACYDVRWWLLDHNSHTFDMLKYNDDDYSVLTLLGVLNTEGIKFWWCWSNDNVDIPYLPQKHHQNECNICLID